MAPIYHRIIRTASVFAISLACCSVSFGQAIAPAPSLNPDMSAGDARKIIQNMGAYARLLADNRGYPVVTDLCCETTSDFLGRRVINNRAKYPIAAVALTRSRMKIHLDKVEKVIVIQLKELNPGVTCTSGHCIVGLGDQSIELALSPDTNAANRLVGALLKSRQAAVSGEMSGSDAHFAETVLAYREAAIKPLLPEEARRFKVQAEGAIRDKDFDAATDLYEQALNLAPWWPEGHFNRAMVLGETGEFPDAIFEMKRYLALVPDAPNARAAQDKIYDWERQAQKK